MHGEVDEVAAAICTDVRSYIWNRYRGRGLKTNKQRRQLSVACGYLINHEQLKIKVFFSRAMTLTGFIQTHIKAGVDNYKKNRARAQRTYEANARGD